MKFKKPREIRTLDNVQKTLKKKNIKLNNPKKFNLAKYGANITCLICGHGKNGEWHRNSLNDILNYNRGCPKCYDVRRRTSDSEFKQIIKKAYGNAYEFTGDIKRKKWSPRKKNKKQVSQTTLVGIRHNECGTIAYRNIPQIRRAVKCMFCSLGSKHWAFNGYGELSGTRINKIKDGAKGRKIKYNLKPKYLWDLFLKQNKKCALSGININFGNEAKDTRYIEETASLDRIDSSKGYIPGNVQWVHKTVNMMKQAYNETDFLKWCRRIVKHSSKL